MSFQHDNARPRTALLTRQFLAQQNIHGLLWPSISPDTNPIEHVWDYIKKIRGCNVRNRQEFQQEWMNFPLAFIRRLISSMSRRCRALEQAVGGHTR
ncbi:MAG: transposase [Candidatus Thiodiazotropha sp.]